MSFGEGLALIAASAAILPPRLYRRTGTKRGTEPRQILQGIAELLGRIDERIR